MFKFISSAAVSLMLLATPALAKGPKAKIFAGDYNGISLIRNAVGDTVSFDPIKVKITKNGKISGTAFKKGQLLTDSGELLTVRGQISKVKTIQGSSYQGKASGSFSDGTKWKATFNGSKLFTSKGAIGTATNGGFSGDFVITSN